MIEIPLWYQVLFVFCLGACVGSFLNVCIYRIPANRSIVSPPSTCPACGARIRWYDNIPIVSWIVLRGRARCCGAWIPLRYPTVEALTAVLFAWAWLAHSPLVAVAGMIFIFILVAASFIDLDHMIIPDRFSVGGLGIGLVLSYLIPELHGFAPTEAAAGLRSLLAAVTGALVGTAVVYWIAALAEIVLRREAMGQGDFKWMGCIGAFCGWQGSLFAIFGGALVGTLIVLPSVLRRRFGDSDENGGDEGPALGAEVPFGPMLAIAGLLYFLWLDSFFDNYLSDSWTALLWLASG